MGRPVRGGTSEERMSQGYPSHYVIDGTLILEDLRIRFDGDASLELRVAYLSPWRSPAFDFSYTGGVASFQFRRLTEMYGLTVDEIERQFSEYLDERRDSIDACWQELEIYSFTWRIDRDGPSGNRFTARVGDDPLDYARVPHFATTFNVATDDLATARREFATLVRLANSYAPRSG